jgi:hypothetical protein
VNENVFPTWKVAFVLFKYNAFPRKAETLKVAFLKAGGTPHTREAFLSPAVAFRELMKGTVPFVEFDEIVIASKFLNHDAKQTTSSAEPHNFLIGAMLGKSALASPLQTNIFIQYLVDKWRITKNHPYSRGTPSKCE